MIDGRRVWGRKDGSVRCSRIIAHAQKPKILVHSTDTSYSLSSFPFSVLLGPSHMALTRPLAYPSLAVLRRSRLLVEEDPLVRSVAA